MANEEFRGQWAELKKLLAAKLGVAQANIILGNGSNDVLELVARAFLTRDDSAIYSQHAFMVYPLAIQAIGAKGIEVPARDFGTDLDAMVAETIPLEGVNDALDKLRRGDSVRSVIVFP